MQGLPLLPNDLGRQNMCFFRVSNLLHMNEEEQDTNEKRMKIRKDSWTC